MINISKLLAVGSLLFNGIISGSTDWEEYELGLELKDFYAVQSEFAVCDYGCMVSKREYLNFFREDCKICMEDMDCYSKMQYVEILDGLYKDIKEITKWEHEIQDIVPLQPEVNEYEYGEYEYGEYAPPKIYTVTVKVDKEYKNGDCTYRSCETEQFIIENGKITSYKVVKVDIKPKMGECNPSHVWTTKSPTSWEKSTTPEPSAPFVPPPSSNPSWSPTTPKPTTSYPTTASPTTPSPTTPSPTTPSPTTPYPTTAWPTNKPTNKPTTSEPTPCPTDKPTPSPTPKPTTSEPTPRPTPGPTTPEPTPKPTTTTAEPTQPNKIITKSPTMWQKSTENPSPAPTKEEKKTCNYPGYEECDYGYKCVKVNEYDPCESEYGYCEGICVMEHIEESAY